MLRRLYCARLDQDLLSSIPLASRPGVFPWPLAIDTGGDSTNQRALPVRLAAGGPVI